MFRYMNSVTLTVIETVSVYLALLFLFGCPNLPSSPFIYDLHLLHLVYLVENYES